MSIAMRIALLLVLAGAPAAAGCKSPYHADQLGGAGALVGAGVGAAVTKSNPLAGAAVGALVGGASGTIIGDALDESEARNQALFQQRMGRQFSGSVTNQDIIAMSQAQLGDQVIISHIRNHGVTAPPTAADLVLLKQQGVSDPVLLAMQQPPPGPPVYAAPPPRPVVVEEHYWGPGPWGPRYYGPPHRHYHGPRVGWAIEYHSR